MSMSSIVALLTDFGTDDSYVAEMKGVMLSLNPDLRFIDITHSIQPGDIREAAYLLWRSHVRFPSSTIFLSVVDPGVGGDRKILLLQTTEYIFVAPDNGLLTLIANEQEYRAWEVTDRSMMLENISATFHGRDIMAPVCAQLSLGSVNPSDLGPRLQEIVKFKVAGLKATASSIEGEVISVDRFGNAITNVPSERLAELGESAGTRVLIGQETIASIGETYSSVKEGETVAYIGSAGLIELAINGGDFAKRFAVKPGDTVRVVKNEE
jgi:S-adenosylmethionine hydrolase